MNLYCRACMSNSNNKSFLVNLCFYTIELGESEKIPVSEAFQSVTGITINPSDEIQKICLLCLAKLQVAFKFWRMANESQELINQKAFSIEMIKCTASSIDLYPDDDLSEVEEEETINLDAPKRLKKLTGFRGARLCYYCNTRCNTKRDLIFHFNRTHGMKIQLQPNRIRYNLCKCCNYCSKKFYSNVEILHHFKETHGFDTGKMKSFKCHTCSRVFSTESSLEKHQKNHSKLYHCSHCSQDFPQKAYFRHRAIVDRQSIVCTICGVQFKDKAYIKTHMQTHSERKMFKCWIEGCERMFRVRKSIFKHIKRNHEEKKVECPMCPTKWTNKGELNFHIKKVHDKVAWNCEQCNRRYACKTRLREHILVVHRGLRINVCPVCSKDYLRKPDMKRHILKAHPEYKDPNADR